MSLPEVIYFIQERRGPTREGPWSDWGDQPEGLIMPRATTTALPLTEEQCAPRCMRSGMTSEVWRELRCIPYKLAPQGWDGTRRPRCPGCMEVDGGHAEGCELSDSKVSICPNCPHAIADHDANVFCRKCECGGYLGAR